MNSLKKPEPTDKDSLRIIFKEKRKILSENKEAKAALDAEIQSRLILSAEYRAADSVLLYAAMEREIATSMIFYAAMANGKRAAFPRCGVDGTMRFYTVSSIDELVPGRFGIFEPGTGAEELIPDEKTLCICPCLCADMSGRRLGYGGGWYDRFLSSFSGKKAALCYADALIPAIDGDSCDVSVDLIVTESYIKRI